MFVLKTQTVKNLVLGRPGERKMGGLLSCSMMEQEGF